MAGCTVVLMLVGIVAVTGALIVTAMIFHFGVLGFGLIAGIILLVLASLVMKIPEIRAKHKVLRIVCIILGITLIVCSIAGIVVSILALVGSMNLLAPASPTPIP